jgi:CRP-like cAMP-binding protein
LDAVKLVKLLIPYPDETRDTTPAARNIRNLVDKSFRACELGQIVVRLMKDLHAFRGLGDGEIIRILQASTQKLFRKGEPVFQEGEAQADMFVVIRGEIHITVSATGDRVLDRLQPGSVFGELAFLNGKPRNASATAAVDTLLLVINREAFDELVQQEQHLGFTVFRNIAIDLSEKLRASTAHLFQK